MYPTGKGGLHFAHTVKYALSYTKSHDQNKLHFFICSGVPIVKEFDRASIELKDCSDNVRVGTMINGASSGAEFILKNWEDSHYDPKCLILVEPIGEI